MMDVFGALKTVGYFHEISVMHIKDHSVWYFILLAFFDKAGCVEKAEYDEYAAFEGKCDGNKDKEMLCVCDTELCNNPNKDDESGVEMIVPQIVMIFSTAFLHTILQFRHLESW